MRVSYNFSDVEPEFDMYWEMLRNEVESVAKQTVEWIRNNKTYNNITYRLVKGYRYEVEEYGSLRLWNIMYYAPYIEAKGLGKMGQGALLAESMLKKL